MQPELTSVEPERERLESTIRRYTSQPLGTMIVGILFVLLGSTWLLGRPEFARRYHEILLAPFMMLGIFLLPTLLRRFYYEPRFGYVKPRTPELSDRQFWLIGLGGAIFFVLLMPFVILPGLQHADSWPLETMTVFLGIGCCVIGTLTYVRDRSSFAGRWVPLGLLLIALGLLPIFHLQTKEQVSKGWFWVAMGVEMCVFGLQDHLLLLRELSRRTGDCLDG